ncbi:MAG: endonuclease domain-containing protein [Opitutaceae bacterium]
MSNGNIHNRPKQKSNCQTLRNKLTPAEARLWTYLKSSQLDGLKFRRQHGVGPYVLDFYCPSEQLAIELDGESHAGPIAAKHDAERTAYLNSLNIRVLRFENEAVFDMPEAVLQRIRENSRKP